MTDENLTAQHPDKDYEIANRVVAFEPSTAIEWEPGFYLEDGRRVRPLDLASARSFSGSTST